MKREFKVNTVIARLYCDTCNVEMLREGVVFGSEPQQFAYRCPICKKKEINSDQYPRVDYKLKRSFRDRFKIWSNN